VASFNTVPPAGHDRLPRDILAGMVAFISDRRLDRPRLAAGRAECHRTQSGLPRHKCRGDPYNCEVLLSSQQAYRERYGKADISGHEAVVSAMAVGLVIDVWRNGPVDAAMFAESTSLHEQAVTALTARNRPIGLLEFEDHLLDRERPWAGTGGKTLKALGYASSDSTAGTSRTTSTGCWASAITPASPTRSNPS
jgi:hypothetical protein